MPYYDDRIVPAHGDSEAKVLLINEAPGPCEAYYQIPSVGDQGGNIYRALQRAEISWVNWVEKFTWPKLILNQYRYPERMQRTFKLRDEALSTRAKFIKCTNAYNRWPRSSRDSYDFVDPGFADVLSSQNISRLRNEITAKHKIILICGDFAWLSCFGDRLTSPASRERTRLSENELRDINEWLLSNFSAGWYMGHTRRWSLDTEGTSRVLRDVARNAEWPAD